MPELPEVETVVRGLDGLRGAVLEDVVLRRDGWRQPVPMATLKAHCGQPVVGLRRRAKWPAVVFADGCLWLHLGMTGQLRLFHAGESVPAPSRHDHLDLRFRDGRLLRFHDARRFGLVAWTDGPDSEPPTREPLGPEPLESGWTAAVLGAALQGVRQPIKPTLMDATRVVGVGNIYASEALFRAGIHPQRPAGELDGPAVKRLHAQVLAVLREGIEAGGSTLQDHRQVDGASGGYQDAHQVYGKAGQACPRCGTLVEKVEQAGRSTFFCPTCQPLQPKRRRSQSGA